MPSPRQIAQRQRRSRERMLRRAGSLQQPQQPLGLFFFVFVESCSIWLQTDSSLADLSSRQIGQRRRRIRERLGRSPPPTTSQVRLDSASLSPRQIAQRRRREREWARKHRTATCVDEASESFPLSSPSSSSSSSDLAHDDFALWPHSNRVLFSVPFYRNIGLTPMYFRVYIQTPHIPTTIHHRRIMLWMMKR